jgi:hypothetical protein
MLSTSAGVDEPIVADVVIASLFVSISVVVATDDVVGLAGAVVDEIVLIVDVVVAIVSFEVVVTLVVDIVAANEVVSAEIVGVVVRVKQPALYVSLS